MARAAAEREDDERACGGASLAASPAAVLVYTCGRRRRDLGFLATPHIPSDTCEHERTHEVGHQAVVDGKRDLTRVAPRCRSGLTAHGECLSLTSRCGPHRLCLVNVGGWGAWPGDWVWVSFFTCEPGTLGGPPQPRLLCPCYLTGVKTRLCSSATAEGGRRHRGASGVLRGAELGRRGTRAFVSLRFLLCSLTFSRCLAHRGAADLALFATVLTALRPCEGSLLPALLFSSARGVQGCPPVLRAPSFVASLVAAACRHRAGSQRRARGDGLVRAAEGPSV